MEWVGLKISKEGLRVLAPRVVGWGSDSSAARTRIGGQALGWGSQGEGQSSVAAKAAVVSGLSFSLEGCSVPVEGATSGKRPGTGRAGKGALRRRRCAGCHDDRTARREPPPPGRERERLAAGSGR
ncbi:unnamed protein product [Rangifer tarandus platyrhynchus]|uniref:Uncharacterized protein n=1 Tax=Rangifer tarandus platyrhynchus TaxID=3082113 RepID=A0ABN8ZX97_RANTA|nr:unnamed protein product [Rangifer tarandus platyrhynchus]